MTDLTGIDVIDWDEAMQQCGDDEEFLRELLGDLRDETDSQMTVMEEVIQNPTDNPFGHIVRAAHVIKGAASNLMCEQLRVTAMALETTAGTAANTPNGKDKPEVLGSVQEKLDALKVAVKNYHDYLASVDV